MNIDIYKKEKIKEAHDLAIDYLLKRQSPNGEFKSLECYPLMGDPIVWKYAKPSPFVHANILYGLLHSNDNRANVILEKGADFLLSRMEYNGFWRFWQIEQGINNVPLDLDDSSISSFVLQKLGKASLSNRKLISSNTHRNGYFKTWLSPSIWNFKMWNALRKEQAYFLPTIIGGMLEMDDDEPGVAANVVLYLGQSKKTSNCISMIIEEITNGGFKQQFYDNKWCVYYHISRAFYHGISAFHQLKAQFENEIKEASISASNTFDSLLMLNIAVNMKMDAEVLEPLLEKLLFNDEILNSAWEPYRYFTSKNRMFYGGAPELTAALFIESSSKLNFQKSV